MVTTICFPVLWVMQLRRLSSNSVESMSFNCGTLSNLCSPSASSEANSSGSAAFLEPLVVTDPFKALPPLMTITSIFYPGLNVYTKAPECVWRALDAEEFCTIRDGMYMAFVWHFYGKPSQPTAITGSLLILNVLCPSHTARLPDSWWWQFAAGQGWSCFAFVFIARRHQHFCGAWERIPNIWWPGISFKNNKMCVIVMGLPDKICLNFYWANF